MSVKRDLISRSSDAEECGLLGWYPVPFGESYRLYAYGQAEQERLLCSENKRPEILQNVGRNLPNDKAESYEHINTLYGKM